MNKQQKEVLQTQLSDEERILKWLKQVYGQAAKDTADKIAELSARTDMENLQTIIYQKQYQEAILKQIQGTLDQLQSDSFLGISDYLGKCYENGYVGAMYDLHGQGIPIITPIDQKQVVRALQTDSKLSQGLYDRLGEDTTSLKKKIKAELSRGVVEGKTYNEIAKMIAGGMTSPFKTASNNAMRIARTEGHRVQLESQNDALYKAKDKGANIVKQWDSTLDARTRDSHAKVDGEIRELDKKFSNGLMFPSDPNGSAAEVCNCRCALLQRAKWNLDQDELDTLQKKASYFGLDKTQNFEEFKTQYLKITQTQAVKKEYLTEKKLSEKIAEAETDLEKMKKELEEEMLGLKNMTPEELQKLQDDFKALELQKAEWEDKLNKKLVAKEVKTISKEQVGLKSDLDKLNTDLSNKPVKTYSGIWKDDVTTADYGLKKDSIDSKKQYFEHKLATTSDPDEIKKWTSLLNDLDEFEKEGKEYFDIQEQIKKTQNLFDKNEKKILSLKKDGIIKNNTVDDKFSEERRNAALWAKNTKDADDVLRDKCGEVWKNATNDEKSAIYEYTQSYHKINEPLRGIEYGTNQYLGVGNVDLDMIGVNYSGFKKGQVKKLIDDMESIISKSTYTEDIWVQRGCGFNGMDKFFGIDANLLRNGTQAELEKALLGKDVTEYGFMSTGVAKGKGFSGDIIMNIFAPAGTQGMYAEPFSAFGNGVGRSWDGVSKQGSFGHESELILQRETHFIINKVEKTNGTIYVDLWVTGQGGGK